MTPYIQVVTTVETRDDAEKIARKALTIAAEICVYTNGNLTVEVIKK